ncbi:MAG TPA: terminase TerL endonuclease subunit [Terriglobales bacterium]|nr:terminase TerL endonuclease subunit [Terriglobales bacterium]
MSKAQQYIDDVLDGTQVVGSWMKKTILRHVSDLKTGAERGLYFDASAGEYVAQFIETFCTPPNQDTPMVLMAWQHAVLFILYGWKRIADGSRRFRRAYLEVAKKNGKTAFVAALCLYHLIADGERSARCFIAATTRKQAGICFKEAVAMRNRHPELKAAIEQSGNEPVHALHLPATGSRLSAMSRDGDSEDGAVVSFACLDELHRWKLGSNIYSVLRYGGRTRKQPLMFEITTAGSSAGGTSLCWAEREYGTKVLDGHVIDDEFCPFIFSMDDKDDWKDSNNWIKPNPSLGVLLDINTSKKEFSEAQGKPTALGEFKRFCLNMWSSEAENPAIELSKWDECCREDLGAHPDPVRLRRESIAALKGRRCFAGVDLAPKLDTSSLVLLFPPDKDGEKWRVIPWFWCPQDNIEGRVKKDRVPYDRWSEDGFITTTEGNLTDVRFISDAIITINKTFDLVELAYDDAWSSELIRMLGEAGFPMQKFVSYPQSHVKMNGPCQEWMRKILRNEFAHDADPVMRWQVSNLRWNTQSSTKFIKPDRDSKREKIDGPAAMIMALARATDPANQKKKQAFWSVTSK